MTFNFSFTSLPNRSQAIDHSQPVVPSQVYNSTFSQHLDHPAIMTPQCKFDPFLPSNLTLAPIVKSQTLPNVFASWYRDQRDQRPENILKLRSSVAVDHHPPISAHPHAYRVLQQRVAYRKSLVQSDTAILLGYPFPSKHKQTNKFCGHIFLCLWEHCQRKEWMTMANLIEHVHMEHIGTGKTFYQCFWQHCSRNLKPFSKRYKIYNHFRTHTGERPFVCRYTGCHQPFSRKETLSAHLKTHLGPETFICPQCDKVSYQTRSTYKHMIIHSSTHNEDWT